MHAERFLELFKLTKAYPNPLGEPTRVVVDFNLIMREGEIVSLIGHSGCGKSTVLTMVAGLNPITTGNVVLAGKEINGPGPDRAVVFQSPCLLPWMTALGNVMLGVNRVYPHVSKNDRLAIAEYYLSLVGLADSMQKFPREMSGGMQQRVGIARAIAVRPKLLLLDEPFGRLDSLTRMELQDVMLGVLNEHRITTMLITHDVDEAIYMSDRICMMTTGPDATLGGVVEVPFERPRDRHTVIESRNYDHVRDRVLTFLAEQDQRKRQRTLVESCIANSSVVAALAADSTV